MGRNDSLKALAPSTPRCQGWGADPMHPAQLQASTGGRGRRAKVSLDDVCLDHCLQAACAGSPGFPLLLCSREFHWRIQKLRLKVSSDQSCLLNPSSFRGIWQMSCHTRSRRFALYRFAGSVYSGRLASMEQHSSPGQRCFLLFLGEIESPRDGRAP